MNITTENASDSITCQFRNNQEILIKAFASEKHKLIQIIALVICIVFFFSTTFLNGVAAVTTWRSRELLRKVCNFTIMIQSIVDLTIGLIVLPLFIAVLATEIAGSPNCLLMNVNEIVSAMFYLYQMTSLSMIHIERYFGVMYPLVHRVHVTKSRLLKYHLSVCGLQSIIFALSVTVESSPKYITCITVTLLTALTLFVYVSIFCSRVHKNHSSGSQISPESNGKRSRLLKDLKIAKSCLLVMLSFMITNLPTAMLTLELFEVRDSYFEALHKGWATMLVFFNSTLNSIIYFWTYKKLRQQGKTLVKKIMK